MFRYIRRHEPDPGNVLGDIVRSLGNWTCQGGANKPGSVRVGRCWGAILAIPFSARSNSQSYDAGLYAAGHIIKNRAIYDANYDHIVGVVHLVLPQRRERAADSHAVVTIGLSP